MQAPRSIRSVALVTVTAAATIFLIQACGGGDATAADDVGEAVEGAWDSSVTVRNCDTGAVSGTFRGLLAIHRGGTVSIDTSAPDHPLRGAILGSWKRGTGPAWTVDASHFRYNADGTLAGTNKIRRTITLSADAGSYTATLDVRILAVDGTQLARFCPTETASRMTF